MGAIKLHVVCGEPKIRAHREELAKQVCSYFESDSRIPGEMRTICYLDDRDVPRLKELWGGHSNKGVHWPIRGSGLNGWPQDMWNTLGGDPISGDVSWPFDSVIYLHGSTCEIGVQLVMTLAHELQHFLQFSDNRQLWAIHILIAKL